MKEGTDMENEPTSNNKAKIIAACVVTLAIAIIYIATSALADNKDPEVPSTSDTSTTSTTSDPTTGNNSSYRDGTYSASGSYRTPETTETIDVTLTVKDGVVTDSSVHQTPQDQESEQYQAEFRQNYKPLVIGKKLSDINLSRVSGSSLTSIGFNKALEEIKAEAQAQGNG